MKHSEDYVYRIEDTPEEYRLRILAEECSELSHASLKMIRAKADHDTPVTKEDALTKLIEEAADVFTVLQVVLTDDQWNDMFDMIDEKRTRWVKRLNDAKILQVSQG